MGREYAQGLLLRHAVGVATAQDLGAVCTLALPAAVRRGFRERGVRRTIRSLVGVPGRTSPYGIDRDESPSVWLARGRTGIPLRGAGVSGKGAGRLACGARAVSRGGRHMAAENRKWCLAGRARRNLCGGRLLCSGEPVRTVGRSAGGGGGSWARSRS